MKEVELQSIKFNISADTESAVNGVEALKNSLSAFSRIRTEAMDNATDSLERLAECVRAISDAASGAESIARLASSLSALGSVNLPDMDFADQIREISDAVRDFETGNVYEIHDVVLTLQTLGQINLPSPELAIRIREISEAALSWDIETSGAMRDLVGVLRSFDGISQIPSGISDGIREILEAAGDIQDDSLRRLGELADILQRLGSVRTGDYRINLEARTNLREVNATARETSGLFGRIQSGLRNIGRSLLALPLSPLRSMASSIRGIGSAVSSLFERVQRIVLYRIIRQALRTITQGFKEGLENLYKYSQAVGTTLAGSMDRLATSALYMKNSLAAMAAPIIEAIAPAIDFVIDKVVEAMNWINQFIAKLTGKDTWTRAVRQATTWGDTTNEAGKNAASGIKAANDELKRSILAFDELNVLSKPNKNVGSTGSGGGSSGTGNGANYATMFEEVPIDGKIGDFAESIKEAFRNGDWYGIGQILGDKLNEIVESLPTYEWGQRIGEKINMAIGIAHGFLETADFSMIGAKIADGINGVLKTVNFKEGGEVLALSLTSVLDLVGGFLGKLDFGAAATAVSDGITGFFGKLSEWVHSKDWETIGKEAYGKVKEFIEGLKLDEIFTSLASFLGETAHAIYEFGYGAGEELGKEIRRGINEAFSEDTKELINNLTPEEIKELSQSDPIASMFTDSKAGEVYRAVGKDIGSSIIIGIGDAITGISDFVHDNIIDPFFSAWDSAWELHLWSIGFKVISWIRSTPVINTLISTLTGLDFSKMPEFSVDASARTGSIKLNDGSDFDFNLIKDEKTHQWTIDLKTGDNTSEALKAIANDRDAWGQFATMFRLDDGIAENLRQAILDGQFDSKANLKASIVDENGNIYFEGSPEYDLLYKKKLDGKAEITTQFNGGDSKFANDFIAGESSFGTVKVAAVLDKENTTTTGKLFWKGEARNANYILKWNLDDTTTTGKNFWNGKGRNALFLPLWNLDNTTTTGKNFWNGQARNATFNVLSQLGSGNSLFSNAWNGKASNATLAVIGALGSNVNAFFSNLWNGKGVSKVVEVIGSLAPSSPDTFQKIWNKNYLSVEAKVNLTKGTDNTGLNLNLWQRAGGGIFQNGSWQSIPQYAGGGFPHGSMFIAGENGAEVVGHIGGRTEVLNASQLAAVMYSSIVAGMSRTSGFEAAVGDALAGRMDDQNRLLEEQNRLLEQMLAGGLVAEISSSSISRAEAWRNRRAGVFAAYG